MKLELHIEQVENERRWNRLQSFEGAPVCFLSYRDDNTFIWLRDSPAGNLAPAPGSTITEPTHVASIADPLLELRQYRLVPGTRRRFTDFLTGRSLDEHRRLGMPVYGPFDSLDDENVVVWFRGFPDLQERDRRKAQFYQGSLWLNELEQIAMPMIEDYSNVMLVTPVR